MIGTLLRSGEISGDVLAEIEGSLGEFASYHLKALQEEVVRTIISPIRLRSVFLGADVTAADAAQHAARGNINGTLHRVCQRSQPDVGYSGFAGGWRWMEVSSMEFVFGGPSVTGESRHYDLYSPIAPSVDEEASNPTIN